MSASGEAISAVNHTPVDCPKCHGRGFSPVRYVPARNGWLGFFARAERLSARCSSCGFWSTWRIGSIRVLAP